MKQAHSRLEKRDLTVRLRKIKSQVEAIEMMVEAGANCRDTLMQVIVVRRALKSFTEKVLNSHIRACIEEVANQSKCRDSLRSLVTVLERYAH